MPPTRASTTRRGWFRRLSRVRLLGCGRGTRARWSPGHVL